MFTEEFGVCILAHIVATTYYSYKLQPKLPIKKLFIYYLPYVLCMHGLFDIIIVGYDFATGEYRCVIRPDGHCTGLLSEYHNTQKIAWFNTIVNKMVQVVFFTVFLMHYYKHTTSGEEDSAARRKINKILFKIVITMGATVGISQVIWFFASLVDTALSIHRIILAVFSMIQQITITIMLSFKLKSRVCKKNYNNKE